MFFHPSDHSMMLVVFVFCCCGAVCRGPKWFMDLNCAFFSFGFSLFSNAPNLLLDVSLANTYTHKKPSRGWSWIQTLWTMGSQPVRYWQLLCKNLYKSKSAFKKEIKKRLSKSLTNKNNRKNYSILSWMAIFEWIKNCNNKHNTGWLFMTFKYIDFN